MEDKTNNELEPLQCRGLRSEYSAVDRDLWKWYCRQRGGGTRRVSRSMLQKHARLAFRKAGIPNFKASNGWYRRWLSRWQKRCPASVSATLRTAVELNSQPQVGDSVKSLHDIKSQHVSSDKHKSENGHKDAILTKVTHCSQNTVFQSQSSEEAQENTDDVEQDGQASLLDLSVNKKKPVTLNCLMNEHTKKILNTLSGEGFIDSGSNLRQNNSRAEQNEEQKRLKGPPVHRDEDEQSQNQNEDSLNIMDYLALHITEGSENTQLSAGGGSECLSHSNTIDNILSSTTGDSIPYCLAPEGRIAHPSTSDTSICSDHPLEFVSMGSQFGALKQIHSSDGQLITQNDETPISKKQQDSEISVTAAGCEVAITVEPFGWDPPASSSHHGDRKKKKKKKKLLSKQLKRGERYVPKFKEKVLAYALSHTLKETAHKFRVNGSTISAWKKDKIMMDYDSNSQPVFTDEADPLENCPAEEQLLAWMQQCREKNHEVSREEVQQMAEKLAVQCSVGPVSHKRTCWFLSWVERMKKQLSEDEMELWMIPGREKERHIMYPRTFKMEVARYAHEHSQTRAFKAFHVSRKRVLEWFNIYKKDQMSDTEVEVNLRNSGGRTAVDVKVDHQLWEWYSKQTRKPSVQEVRDKGLELYRAVGHNHVKCSPGWYTRWRHRFQVAGRNDGDEVVLEWVLTRLEQGHAVSLVDLQAQAVTLLSESKSMPFKASCGWAMRFCKRYPELLYHYPSVEVKLPACLMEKVKEFRSYVRSILRGKEMNPSAVGCMDEVHVNLSTLSPVSAKNGTRRQLLRRPDMGNCHLTVVLACLADGTLLPPMVITVGNLDPEMEDGQDMMVAYQENARMDEKCMKLWLEHFWFKRVTMPSVLVMDCYESHTLPSIKEACDSLDTSCLIIPGGCASKLQPLDVAVKKNFQEAIEKEWTAYRSMQGSMMWEAGSSVQLPNHQKVTEWVGIAYKHIQSTMQKTILRSFLATGIMAAEDYSEDILIEDLPIAVIDNA